MTISISTDAGKHPVIQTPEVDTISLTYVRSLRQRCEEDLINGNYDIHVCGGNDSLSIIYAASVSDCLSDTNRKPEERESGKICLGLYNRSIP